MVSFLLFFFCIEYSWTIVAYIQSGFAVFCFVFLFFAIFLFFHFDLISCKYFSAGKQISFSRCVKYLQKVTGAKV